MAHEVESMFYVGETPWHGLGVNVDEGVTTEDAIKHAGLDWRVSLEPIFTKSEGFMQKIDFKKAVMRNSDKTVLGVVGNSYTPVQNSEAFAFFDPFVQNGEAVYETAGSLKNGKIVWILARLNRDPVEVVSNDIVNKYLLLHNAHDGSRSLGIGFNPVRVVCANTLRAAVNATAAKMLRICHTKSIHDSLDEVREIVDAADATFTATGEQYRALARKNIVTKDLEQYVQRVFYPGLNVKKMSKSQSTRHDTLQHNIHRLFVEGAGQDNPKVRGTLWAGYNAVTEYLSYNDQNRKKPDADGNLVSLWFGHNAKLNERAFEVATSMVA